VCGGEKDGMGRTTALWEKREKREKEDGECVEVWRHGGCVQDKRT